MSLNIILGKPKTGKSSYIYEKIEEDIENNRNVILFVPSQQRQETENNYMEFLKKDGIIGVNITTISEYVKENIIKLGLYNDEKYISKEDKKMILADVVLRSTDKLSIFKNVSKKEGFLELIYIYIDLLRKSNFNLSMLEKIDINDKLKFEKLNEICKIYELYQKQVESKFVDSIDEIEIFLKNISKLDFSNTNIYFDSYNNFTEGEFEIVKNFLTLASNITISLTTDISKVEDIYSNNTNDIFETSNLTYLRLLKIASACGVEVSNKIMYIKYLKQSEDIKYLSNNIFENNRVVKKDAPNINITLYSNTFSEIISIANIINKKVREGYRYKDFDIYTTDVDKYKSVITRVFFDTKIPVYINSKENIKFSKLTIYILKLLDLLKSGIKKDLILDILKLGFTDIKKEDIYEFENYILEFNINDYYMSKPFKFNNKNNHIYDLDKLNEIREKLVSIYDLKINKKANANYYITYIYEHLINNNILKKYGETLEILEKSSNEFDVSNLAKEKQVWGKICEIFNSISKVYKENITFDDFIHVFKLQVKDTMVKVAPPVLDSVNLLDINLSNMKTSKIAFFIGVNEGCFPKIIEEDILFSDEDLNSLNKSGINLKETTTSKQNMALYNIYNALNSITDELYISVPTSDYSGKALRISEVINDIKRVVNVEIQGNTVNDNSDVKLKNIYSKNEVLEYMLSLINSSKNIEEILTIYNYIQNDNMYNELLSYKKDDDNLKDETLKIIYNDKFNTSISKLELFKKCPFSYYMKYLLKIEPRREFEISSLDIGSFMHEVLEKFSKYLFDNNICWHELLTNDLWKEKLYDIIDEKLESNLGDKKQSIKYGILKEKLINTMKKVVLVIANSFNQSEFVPFGYEIEFKEGKIFAPIKIQIDKNKTMNIIGKIDRVDTLKIEDKMYVRVVDYKSSRKDLKLEDIKEGISLQLITYLYSFIENINKEKEGIKKVIPAGMLYFNLSDKLVNLKDYISDEEKVKDETIKALRMKGIFLKDLKIIEKMDNKISTDKRLIDISKITLNKENTNRALTEDEYDNLFNETKEILKNIGKEITDGVVKIKPNKKTKCCNYCNYSSICRKDSIT